MSVLKVISPIDGEVYVERPLATWDEVDTVLENARRAQEAWRHTSLEERKAVCERFCDALLRVKDEAGEELARQMGRPIRYAPKEVATCVDRARTMIRLADAGLADVKVEEKAGFHRFIRREPLGVVLTVPAWNYPYLIAVNSVVPAILAGNAVVLKHSSQTPLVGERFAAAFKEAGLPEHLCVSLHADHAVTERAVADSRVDFVAFTGSVKGGHAMVEAARERFVGIGLELGGKDPAYVRPDTDLNNAVENLVDGAFFNSGQSCCGIERIYVHEDVYDRFVEGFAELTRTYVLGNPLDEATTLGPMVRTGAADFVRREIADAVKKGARALIDEAAFKLSKPGTPYLAPQVLVDVDHGMSIMTEETFGPAVGIMKVKDDKEAIRLMNDSAFGLTASVWTKDEDAALAIGDAVSTGTWFMNRCDFLDPELAWVGVKDSGRGCTLSRVGYEHLTRPKSFHLKIG